MEVIYLVFADGREFGVDYSSYQAARRVADLYAKHFPEITYTIGKRLYEEKEEEGPKA